MIKFNELLANCVIYSTAQDITDAANAIAADGHPVDLDDLATISPHITHVIRRFGNRILNLTPAPPTPPPDSTSSPKSSSPHNWRLGRRCGCSSAPKGCGSPSRPTAGLLRRAAQDVGRREKLSAAAH
ncbi:Tn3 family transposase [Streptosporangium lutulentum]